MVDEGFLLKLIKEFSCNFTSFDKFQLFVFKMRFCKSFKPFFAIQLLMCLVFPRQSIISSLNRKLILANLLLEFSEVSSKDMLAFVPGEFLSAYFQRLVSFKLDSETFFLQAS